MTSMTDKLNTITYSSRSNSTIEINRKNKDDHMLTPQRIDDLRSFKNIVDS